MTRSGNIAERSSRKIILLSCSSRKLSRPAPAAELYQGTLFRASLEWARQQKSDAIFILSAMHHLLGLDDEIDPYDLTLNDLPASQLREWAGVVLNQLEQHTNLQRDNYVILAGEKYRRYLLPHLKRVSLPLEGLPIGKQVQFLQRQLAGEGSSVKDEAPSCGQVHSHLGSLPRHRVPFDPAKLPANGIYVLFEQGESAHGTDRIVRIGTHRGQGQLPGRLQEHFVNENKDRSIFRNNIGRAMLHRDRSPLLDQWELDLTTRKAREQHNHQIDSTAMSQIEQRVSDYIRERLSFAVVTMEDKEVRMRLETGLIATVNNCPVCGPSSGWLGQHSPKSRIRESGLWLVQGLNGAPLGADEWQVIRLGITANLPKPTRPPERQRQPKLGRPAGLPGKYAALTDYLQNTDKDQVTLSFRQMEEILGFPLPKSARKYRPWWANQKAPHMSPQSRSWQEAGFILDSVKPEENGWAVFRRLDGIITGSQTTRGRK